MIAGNEWWRVWRRPSSYVGILLAAVFLWAALAHGVTTDFKHVPVGAYVEEESPVTQGYLRVLGDYEALEVVRCRSEEELNDLFAEGKVTAAIFVPDMSQGPSAVRVLLDGSELGLALHARSTIAQITSGYASALANRRLQEGGQLPEQWPIDEPLIRVDTTTPFSPTLDGRDYALVSMAAPVLCILLIGVAALSVVRDKESGRMDLYRVSEVSATELVLGRSLPYAALGFAVSAVILTACSLELEVVVIERAPLILLLVLPYIFGCIFAGLALSACAPTSARALETCVVLALPMLFLSGFFFPISQMPTWGQVGSFFTPSRHLSSLLRAMLLRREGLTACWPELAWGLGFCAVAYCFSWYGMRRELRKVA